jgi:hypothetical protein
MQRCVPASAFQHLCSSICVSASVCQHLRLCFSFYVPASLVCVDILDCSITDCHQWHSLTVFVISCVAAFVSVFQQLCSSICVSASVCQHLRLCFSFYVPASLVRVDILDCSITDCHQWHSLTVFVISCVAAFVSVFQQLCSSICVSSICAPAFVFQHLRFSIRVSFVFQHLSSSFYVPTFVF